MLFGFNPPSSAQAAEEQGRPCPQLRCLTPETGDAEIELRAADVVSGGRPGLYLATLSAPTVPAYRWRLETPCNLTDPVTGGCEQIGRDCPEVTGRLIGYYAIQRQRLAQPLDAQGNQPPVDGVSPPTPVEPGTPYFHWSTLTTACVDITDLNPPPSPDEVFRYFQTLPLPELTTRQQPPGNALTNLPVIFYTDSPATQTFTVDIRGFTVVIVATATGYTWHTGDGTTLTTEHPGARYPDHSITHEYDSGTYTASLTTTWGGTFSVDGGVQADVPGTTTTDGPPVSFTVLQARPVLTNPYD
ncbi:hypothetical protein A7K94_0204895 [Modestobacter sp. VKM Ac-2676]|nr:hypothetical protein A7K94_0204895 [Modestobacter sp. VKM Ac-2676]